MIVLGCGCAVDVASVALLGSGQSTWTENKAEHDRTE